MEPFTLAGGAGDAGSTNGDQNDSDNNEFVVSSPENSVQLADEKVWTTEEFENATPCNIIEISEEDLKKMREEADDDGGSQSSEGGLPEDQAKDTEGDLQATSGGYNYPPPGTRYEVFDEYTAWPYRTVGKLFFRRGGRNYVCSAASVGNNAIWTAGHCLHSGNGKSSGWATDVVFVPAYKDGKEPYGRWRAKQLFTSPTWYKKGISGGLTEDWGGAILFPVSGKKISQRVGWLGFATNFNRYQHWHAFGYPAAAPFNGRRMIVASGSFAYKGNVGGTDTNGMGNDMTGGSSGGPWIMRLGTGNFINGNNSYRISNKPKEMFSPYFNTNANNFRKYIVAR